MTTELDADISDQPPGLSGSKLLSTLRLGDRREPLVTRIVEWVGVAIIEGRLAPGQELSSVELARQFSTSRTPVREALMVLEQEGLVEMRARRRPLVAAPSLREVRDIYQVRRNLLALAARLVVERADDAGVDAVAERVLTLREYADSNDVDSYFWHHVDLQDFLLHLAGNATLKQILDLLSFQTLALRHRSIAQPGRLQQSISEQEQMVQAYRSRDADLASALIAGSTTNALRAIERSTEPDRAPTRRGSRPSVDRNSSARTADSGLVVVEGLPPTS